MTKKTSLLSEEKKAIYEFWHMIEAFYFSGSDGINELVKHYKDDTLSAEERIKINKIKRMLSILNSQPFDVLMERYRNDTLSSDEKELMEELKSMVDGFLGISHRKG